MCFRHIVEQETIQIKYFFNWGSLQKSYIGDWSFDVQFNVSGDLRHDLFIVATRYSMIIFVCPSSESVKLAIGKSEFENLINVFLDSLQSEQLNRWVWALTMCVVEDW